MCIELFIKRSYGCVVCVKDECLRFVRFYCFVSMLPFVWVGVDEKHEEFRILFASIYFYALTRS